MYSIYPALTREIFLPRDHLFQRHSVRVAESFVKSCSSVYRSKLVSYCSYYRPLYCTVQYSLPRVWNRWHNSSRNGPWFSSVYSFSIPRGPGLYRIMPLCRLGRCILAVLCCYSNGGSVVDVISMEEAVFLFVYSFPIGPHQSSQYARRFIGIP